MDRLVVLAIGTLAVGVLFVAAARPAGAAGLPPKLKPSAIVRVATGEGSDFCTPRASNSSEFKNRLHPDGTTTPFVVPPGRVFVVTSLNWTANGTVGESALLFVSLLNRAAGTTTLHIDHTSSAVLAATDTLAISEELAVPIVVPPTAALCSQSFGTAGIGRAVAEGYLTKDR